MALLSEKTVQMPLYSLADSAHESLLEAMLTGVIASRFQLGE